MATTRATTAIDYVKNHRRMLQWQLRKANNELDQATTEGWSAQRTHDAETNYVHQIRKLWYMDHVGIILLSDQRSFIMSREQRMQNEELRDRDVQKHGRSTPRLARIRYAPDFQAELMDRLHQPFDVAEPPTAVIEPGPAPSPAAETPGLAAPPAAIPDPPPTAEAPGPAAPPAAIPVKAHPPWLVALPVGVKAPPTVKGPPPLAASAKAGLSDRLPPNVQHHLNQFLINLDQFQLTVPLPPQKKEPPSNMEGVSGLLDNMMLRNPWPPRPSALAPLEAARPPWPTPAYRVQPTTAPPTASVPASSTEAPPTASVPFFESGAPGGTAGKRRHLAKTVRHRHKSIKYEPHVPMPTRSVPQLVYEPHEMHPSDEYDWTLQPDHEEELQLREKRN